MSALLLGAIAVVAVVIGVSYSRGRGKGEKPGMRLFYEAPGKTPALCRALLEGANPEDLFTCALERAKDGGWYLHFLRENTTHQPLDTLYRLEFEEGEPALLALTFVREAFGMREPVLPVEMLDEYFAAKLGARRVARAPGRDGNA